MAARKSLHVVPAPNGGWSVKHYGSSRALRHFNGKGEAVSFSRDLARNQGGELFIHRADGSVQEKTQYLGSDSFPARGLDHHVASG